MANASDQTEVGLKRNIGYRLLDTAQGMAGDALYNNHDAIILWGHVPIPIVGVQYLEIARSLDLLEYRAVGAEFLAQQKGGNLGCRIDVEFDEGMGNIWMTMYNAMMKYGKVRELSKIDDATASVNNIAASNNAATMISGKTAHGTTINSYVNYNEPTRREQVENDAFKNGETLTLPDDYSIYKTVWHKTFTLYTEYEILFDMYIETIQMSRDERNGINVRKATILLRQFNPGPLLEKSELVLADNNNDYSLHKKDPMNHTLLRKNSYKDRYKKREKNGNSYKHSLTNTIQSMINITMPGKRIDFSGEMLFDVPEIVDFIINLGYSIGKTAIGKYNKTTKGIRKYSLLG